jgi:hypothetical protein
VAGEWLFDEGLGDVLKGSIFLSVRALRVTDKVGWQGCEDRYKIVPVLVQEANSIWMRPIGQWMPDLGQRASPRIAAA